METSSGARTGAEDRRDSVGSGDVSGTGETKAAKSESVVFVSQQFPPDKSGHASRIYDTSVELANDGWDVTVLAPPASFPPQEFSRSWERQEQTSVDDVTVLRLWTWQPISPDPGFFTRITFYLLFALHATLWLTVHGRKYDVVVTTTPPISTGIAGIPSVIYGQSWVVDVRDLWIDASVSLGFISKGGLLERASRRFQRRVLLTADSIAVTTETLGDVLCEQYGESLGEKMIRVPNGVDVSAFRARTNGGSPEPSNDRESDQYVVVYTGNIGHAQGLEASIKALQFLPENVVLHLVGGGDAVPGLQERAGALDVRDRVEFVGPIPHERIPEIIAEADVGLAPLRDDADLSYAMPTKVYEYLCGELPVVATGNGEIRRFIENSGAGIHVGNEPKLLASALRELVEDEERRMEYGKQGFEYVRHEYDRHRITARFSDHLRRLATDERSGVTEAETT